MIDRQNGYIVFECDECGDAFESETRNFRDAWDDAKSAGWIAYKDKDGDFCHACPGCKWS